MQYTLLIFNDEAGWARLSEEERGRMLREFGAFTQELRDAGAYVGSNRLQSAETAATVRVRHGETLTTDGPFAETKEQLGGYYIIEADSLDQAVEWAAKIPSARAGTIEVRPIMPVSLEATA